MQAYETSCVLQNTNHQSLFLFFGIIAYAKKEITVQNASEEDKKYLDMKGFDMIVVVKSYTYLDDTSLFQYTESRHRPDKFVFVDFARRH